MQKQIIDVSFWTMLKVALLALLVWAIWMLRDILSVLLLSIIIASAIEPANHWFARHRIPRVLGVIFIFLLAFSIFVSIFYLVLPPLFSDIFGFLSQLPVYVKQTFAPHGVVFSYFPDLPLAFKRSMLDTAILLEKSFESYVPIIGSGAIGAGSSLFGGVIMFILLIVISFYLSVQEHGIEKFLRIITPLEHETYILDLWKRAQRKIGRWLQGQFLLGVLVGVMVFLMLMILNVPHASILALLAAVFEIIPIFGPIMAAIPAIAIASLQSTTLGLLVLGLFVIVQQIENHLIYPLVVRKTIGVPPLLVVLAVVVGAKLGGFFGILLSVPIAAVLVEFLNDISARKYPQ